MDRELLLSRFILVAEPKLNDTVVKEVLDYFLRNPKAADSLEGITRWRLLDEAIRRKVTETQQALDWLVRRKFLKKTTVPGKEPVFSLNRDKLAEAEAFVAGDSAPAKIRKR